MDIYYDFIDVPKIKAIYELAICDVTCTYTPHPAPQQQQQRKAAIFCLLPVCLVVSLQKALLVALENVFSGSSYVVDNQHKLMESLASEGLLFLLKYARETLGCSWDSRAIFFAGYLLT